MFNIALDGPAGAGKSTIAKLIAKKLNILYLDTGAMYRAIALFTAENGISVLDKPKIVTSLESTMIDIVFYEGRQIVKLNGKDVSEDIRQHHISKIASDVSAIPEVRIKLVEQMRRISGEQSSILDGRDIGSYVLPDAKYKFYLTADIDVRAKRRCLELAEKGQAVDFCKVKQDIEQRDYNDSNRSFSPLVKAKDAIEVDTTNFTIDQVVDFITKYIKE